MSAETQKINTEEVQSLRRTTASNALLEQLREATLGDYEILSELGSGGMAVVYLAHDLSLDRKVAIKVLSPGLVVLNDAISERFLREARTVAALSHPHIVPIYAVKDNNHLLYFAMKYIKGVTLEALIAENGTVPPQLSQAIITQVASALGYAHRQGVVHRDVKPGNILLDDDGWVYMTDFGIAKVFEGEGLTQTGGTVGTPAYMSPEQCAGQPVTGASDQYSLGIVAYEMLTGQAPFSADSPMTVMYKHCHTPPEPIHAVLPNAPPRLAQAIMRMLEKDPNARWPSLEDMVSSLGRTSAAETETVRTQIVSLAARTPYPVGHNYHTPASPVPGGPPVTDSGRVGSGTSSEAATVLAVEPAKPRQTGLWILMGGGATAAAVAVALWAPWQRDPTPVPPAVPPAVATEVQVNPGDPTLVVGETTRLSASVLDATGARIAAARIAWTSTDTAVVTVSSGGLARGVGPGNAMVVASSGDVADTARVRVDRPVQTVRNPQPQPDQPRPAAVASVTIDPQGAEAVPGDTVQFTASLASRNGTPLTGRRVAWTSNNEAIATVDADGRAVALRPGTVVITATSENHVDAVALTVAPPSVAVVRVTPSRLDLSVGGTARLRAETLSGRGESLNRPVAWGTSDDNVVAVAEDGTVRAVGPGNATVRATSESARADVPVIIRPATPDPPEAPPAPPDPRADIQRILQAYEAAIEAEDLAELVRVYPGMLEHQRDGWEALFERFRDIRVDLDAQQARVTADTARVAVQMTIDYRGAQEPQAAPFTAIFVYTPQGWQLRSVL